MLATLPRLNYEPHLPLYFPFYYVKKEEHRASDQNLNGENFEHSHRLFDL